MTSAATFVALVIGKIEYLGNNPKSVNVDIDYKNSLPFPAVTFCNMNPYRLLYFLMLFLPMSFMKIIYERSAILPVVDS